MPACKIKWLHIGKARPKLASVKCMITTALSASNCNKKAIAAVLTGRPVDSTGFEFVCEVSKLSLLLEYEWLSICLGLVVCVCKRLMPAIGSSQSQWLQPNPLLLFLWLF